MDHKFTEEIQAWLDTPVASRDYAQGALYLLQLSNNKILYRNISANPKKYADSIEYQIRKYMKFRLAQLTHQQVEVMQVQADRIVREHFGYQTEASTNNTTSSTEYQRGKRQDHDDLPADIQALYVENLNILHQIRELHLQLRNLSTENATCPDSERYPFLKELIAKDKQYHKNWEQYDHYVIGGSSEAEQSINDDVRTQSRHAGRQLNLLKGKYKKNPSEEMKLKIQTLYGQLLNPSDKLTNELQELGIL